MFKKIKKIKQKVENNKPLMITYKAVITKKITAFLFSLKIKICEF